MENADFYDKPVGFRYKGKSSYGNCCGTFCTVTTIILFLAITAFRIQYYLIQGNNLVVNSYITYEYEEERGPLNLYESNGDIMMGFEQLDPSANDLLKPEDDLKAINKFGFLVVSQLELDSTGAPTQRGKPLPLHKMDTSLKKTKSLKKSFMMELGNTQSVHLQGQDEEAEQLQYMRFQFIPCQQQYLGRRLHDGHEHEDGLTENSENSEPGTQTEPQGDLAGDNSEVQADPDAVTPNDGG